MNIYVLSYVAFEFSSGRFGDLFTSKKTFIVGLIVFLIASLACALSVSVNMLIASRCLQGFGASLAFTVGMSLVTAAAPKENRGKVIAKILSIPLLSLAVAPILGGVIAHYLIWRWVFYLNWLPGGIFLILIKSVLYISEKKS